MPSEDLVVVKVAPFNAESPTEQLGHDLTPLSSFYVRSNFDVPKIDPVSYHLHVGGKVNQPLALGLDELKALGAVTLTSTLECAGNHRMGLTPMPTGEPWAGGAVSTAQWTGVPLRAVLRRAGIQSDVIEILATGADQGKPKDHPEVISFQRSLPLAKALHPDTLLAYEMNGEPLQPSHGAPLRVVVPGWYGMAGVKWLTRLEAITAPFTGYYQASRYIFDYGDDANPQPVNTIRPKSIIVDPSEGVTVSAGSVLVRDALGQEPEQLLPLKWQLMAVHLGNPRACSTKHRRTLGEYGSSRGTPPIRGVTHCVHAPPTKPATRSPTARAGTATAMAATACDY